MTSKNRRLKKPSYNIIKRFTFAFNIQILLFLISCIIGEKLFWYDAVDLPSECMQIGEEKAVTTGDGKDFPFLLSYGPYQETKRGNYLVVLRYDVHEEGSIYQIYTDMGQEVIEEGNLAPKHHYICTVVKKPNVAIQMLVRYGGEGSIKVYYVSVYPIWLILFGILCIVGIVVYLVIREDWIKYVLFFVRGITSVLFIGTIYYVDCTANVVKDKWSFGILIMSGIIIVLSCFFGRIRKRELLLLASLIECCFIEWRNILNYEYSFISLYLTLLLSLALLLLIYCLAQGKRIYLFLIFIVTTVFSLYSISQYMYYCYFNDFFTLKIVHLLFTAMEATASIQELISGEVLLQIYSLLIYYVGLVTVYILLPRTKLYERISAIKLWRSK